ncbi:MAG: class I SAM-dependent methyltransferase [Candidatus Paceibacterota bacterium]|jgi:SAM-dependent methyltransferase
MNSSNEIVQDKKTADAFANSWNNLPSGSIYTEDQFTDWMMPLERKDIEGKRVLELGCGNGSLMSHMVSWNPSYLEGVDLGDSVLSAESNLRKTNYKNWKVTKGDLTEYRSAGFDVVYCIGVIHHLKVPEKGFESVIKNTKRGGRFHVWVYAREGNSIIVYFVDPIRKVVSHLPWWFTKYFVATPLVVPYYLYAKFLSLFKRNSLLEKLPLYEYSLWISKREFAFFRHVAFDQLVTPQTAYIKKEVIESWLNSCSGIDKTSTYIIMRNGNSWKFGGRVKI